MIDRRTVVLALSAAACASIEAPRLTDTIFELRNYALKPAERDTLITLFEREFVESQEAVGARIVGTFRDLDNPDHFVWLRSFADMAARRRALESFYGGPVWQAHRDAANATMIDVDNVLLLHPVGAPLALPLARPPVGATELGDAMIAVDIFDRGDRRDEEWGALASGAPGLIAMFSTEESPNNFPSLPVRDDRVFVALRRYDRIDRIAPSTGLPAPKQTLRLQPTARSLLR